MSSPNQTRAKRRVNLDWTWFLMNANINLSAGCINITIITVNQKIHFPVQDRILGLTRFHWQIVCCFIRAKLKKQQMKHVDGFFGVQWFTKRSGKTGACTCICIIIIITTKKCKYLSVTDGQLISHLLWLFSVYSIYVSFMSINWRGKQVSVTHVGQPSPVETVKRVRKAHSTLS